MKKILFVCTGNTCRSPMAEWIFKILVEENNLDGWIVGSAGTSAFDGDDASKNSIRVMLDEFGVDIGNHRSRRLKSYLVDESDLILTMTESHKRAVLKQFPESESKVFTLKGYVEETGDVLDPYGMNYDEYFRVANEIRESLNLLVKKLREQPV